MTPSIRRWLTLLLALLLRAHPTTASPPAVPPPAPVAPPDVPPPAPVATGPALRARLASSVRRFRHQFVGLRLDGAVRLGSGRAFRQALGPSLSIRLDPALTAQGRYEATGRRSGRLALQGPPPPGGDMTLWHELVHRILHLRSPQQCGPEEAYLELCEARIVWLSYVRAFELALRGPLASPSARARSWALRERTWHEQHLSGPFTWRNVGGDRTCRTVVLPLPGPAARLADEPESFTLSPGQIRQLDAVLGFDVRIERVRALYFPRRRYHRRRTHHRAGLRGQRRTRSKSIQ